jgi:hypothetical protein
MTARGVLDYFSKTHDFSPALPIAEYDALLSQFLTERPEKEVRFFLNEKRFYLLNTVMGDVLRTKIKTLLNVACGPFAFENYMNLGDAVALTAFDMDDKVAPLFDALQARGYFKRHQFQTASLESFTSAQTYDLVLINDVFYTKYLDFYQNIQKYADFVAQNGYLYFDVLDQKSGWLWALFRKDDRYRRYDLAQVEALMQRVGFALVRTAPSLGIKGGLDYWVRKLLYNAFGIANNHVYLYQKRA